MRFLIVYEYNDTLFGRTIWAALTEGEQAPEDSRLLCTVNQNDHVDWKIDDLIQTPIAKTGLPSLYEIKLPIEEVQFNNITITIASTDPAAASALLPALASFGFEYTTDSFQTHGAAGESEEQSTTLLFPHDSHESEQRQPITTA